MAVNLSNVEQAIVSELKISQDEAKAFLAIVKKGKMDQEKLSGALGWQSRSWAGAWRLK
jgi:predicted transcriptional regulator